MSNVGGNRIILCTRDFDSRTDKLFEKLNRLKLSF